MIKLREYILDSGKKVVLGKSAETNEDLVAQAGKNEYVLHTKMPGSPFTNIKAEKEETSKEELYQAGVMCAKHSQDWRDGKKDVMVDVFLGKDIYKDNKMKSGTFGVKGSKEMRVKKVDIEKFEEKIKQI